MDVDDRSYLQIRFNRCISLGLGAIATVSLFYFGLFTPSFNVDSWSYLELSSTVFSDFFRYNTLRQYSDHSPYSNSFPPLWPVCIAIARQCGLDYGIYTGYLLNFFCILLLMVRIVLLAEKLGLPSMIGCIVYLALLSFRAFILEDVLAGGSLALSLILFLSALHTLIVEKVDFRHTIQAGIWIGLACLTRFDYAFAAIYIAFHIFIRQSNSISRRILLTAAYCTVVVIVLLPWMIYNFQHFGKPFASDNSRQVLAINPNSVLDYYPDTPATITSHPKEWCVGLITKKSTRLVRGLWEVCSSTPVAILLVFLMLYRKTEDQNLGEKYYLFRRLCIPVLLLGCVPVLLVGYGMIGRYYTLHVILVLLMSFPHLHVSNSQAWGYSKNVRFLFVLSLLVLKPFCPAFIELKMNIMNPKSHMISNAPDETMTQVKEILSQVEGSHRILITDDLLAAQYGAQSGEQVALKPILRGEFSKYIAEWNITHLYDPIGWHKTISPSGLSLESLSAPGLYRIVRN